MFGKTHTLENGIGCDKSHGSGHSKQMQDLVGLKGSDGTRLAINQQMIAHFSVE